MRIFGVLLLLALASPALAQNVDLAHPPASVCTPVLQVAENSPNCPANGSFVREAKNCLRALEQSEASLGAESIAAAKAGLATQRVENDKAESGYGFSSAALAYLISAYSTAQEQLMEYHGYVVPPPFPLNGQAETGGEDPFGWADEVACFGDAHEQLSAVEKAMEEKIARFTARRKEALAYEQKLKGTGTNYQSLNGAAAKGRDQRKATAQPGGSSSAGQSDVTGVAEDLAKEKAKEKAMH
jgi:hypothetical protein